MNAFDPAAYWSSREHKKWVVVLTWRNHAAASRRDRDAAETKYVGARSREGAIATARGHSTAPKHAGAYARLATPRDLGCVEICACDGVPASNDTAGRALAATSSRRSG